jgi:hypothetical protein
VDFKASIRRSGGGLKEEWKAGLSSSESLKPSTENHTTHFLESHLTAKKTARKQNAETHFVDSKHPLEDHGEKKHKMHWSKSIA